MFVCLHVLECGVHKLLCANDGREEADGCGRITSHGYH